MSLADLVNVTIQVAASAPSLANFGTPLIAAYHTKYGDRVRTYSALSELVTDGFAVTDPAYLAAQALLSQSPHPPNFKLGRRALPYTQIIHLSCLDATAGDIYSFTVGLPGQTANQITYTVPGSSSTTAVATAIAALITALSLSGLTVSTPGSSNVIALTMTAGSLIDVQTDAVHLSLSDVTTDPGIATDLAAIAAFDNGWYGLGLDSQSSAEVQAAAAWVESNQKIFPANNSDTDNGSTPGGDTSSLAYHLKNLAYTRTGMLFSQSKLLSYSGLAWLSGRLTATPGSDTWAYKGPLTGVPVDNLTESVYANVLAKNGNVYITVANADFTLMGTSGSGEFFDTVRFIDFLQNDMQISILAALLANPKIPYTDAGMSIIQSLMLGSLDRGIKAGGLAATPQPTVTIPPVATQNVANVAVRAVPGITFQATLAGAVHTLVINGSVVLP